VWTARLETRLLACSTAPRRCVSHRSSPYFGGEQQSLGTPTGRERMGSPALQPFQDPILLTPWVCFRVAAFQTRSQQVTQPARGWRVDPISPLTLRLPRAIRSD
jgi:hypothetical protein